MVAPRVTAIRSGSGDVLAGEAMVATLVAFDPGTHIGVAWLDPDGAAVRLTTVALDDLSDLSLPPTATVLVGDGTGRKEVVARLRSRGFEPQVVDERNTTLEARQLYFRDHPARGLARLLPPGMRSPPRKLDDYAAYAIALRWRRTQAAGS